MNNNLVEILANNNPFLSPYISDDNIGVNFSIDDFNIGDIVCTSELYDELINRFGSYENAKKFYEFARTLIAKGEYSNYGEGDSIPYLNFTVYLEESIADEGIYKPYVENWVPNKKYYLGDMVYYSVDGTFENTKCYVLTDCGDEIPDHIEVSEETYNANHENNSYYFIDDGKYYLELPFYRGYYDELTKITYFDTYVDGKIEFEHWLDTTLNTTTYDVPDTTTGITSSQIASVRRSRTDMDISGNTLPFILHYNVVNDNGIYKKRELDKTTTELQYMCGFNGIRYGDAGLCADVLLEIDFYYTDEMSQEYDPTKAYICSIDDKQDIPILINEIDDTYNTVRFVYYTDATIEENKTTHKWGVKSNSGVKYTEIYNYQKKEITVNIEGNEDITYKYFELGDNKETMTTLNENNKALSTIEVTKEQILNDNFFNVPIFKDESTLGLSDSVNKIDANIDRGISASFEKHNALGEICTLSDMENYRNDYFKITK